MKTVTPIHNEQAEWQWLLAEAEEISRHDLDALMQAYVLHTLLDHHGRVDTVLGVLPAVDAIEAMAAGLSERGRRLKKLADESLLALGLFADKVEDQLGDVGFLARLGRATYAEIADSSEGEVAELFSQLADHFNALLDVLQVMRDLAGDPDRNLLGAAELWSQTGSGAAYRRVASQTHGNLAAMPEAVQ